MRQAGAQTLFDFLSCANFLLGTGCGNRAESPHSPRRGPKLGSFPGVLGQRPGHPSPGKAATLFGIAEGGGGGAEGRAWGR